VNVKITTSGGEASEGRSARVSVAGVVCFVVLVK
jgi:hypothetical protein